MFRLVVGFGTQCGRNDRRITTTGCRKGRVAAVLQGPLIIGATPGVVGVDQARVVAPPSELPVALSISTALLC